VIVSLLYKVSRRLLSAPAVLPRRDSTNDNTCHDPKNALAARR
jgi:hypothetical protein